MDENTAKVCQILGRLVDMAHDAGRDDLARRLRGSRARIDDPAARVVVVGQLKQGKSHLINALLNVPVARVGDGETTSTITVVGHSEQPRARLIVEEPQPDDSGRVRERSIELPIDAVSRDLSHAPEAGGARVVRLEIGVPSPLLARGLVVVDTPGTGGVGNPHASGTLGLLASSDAIVIASDVSQEYTAPEMSFIRQANELCGNALVVGTKTDLYPMWREVVDADIAHLRKQGTDLTPLPVSSVLRDHAIRLNDTELNDESGFPAILEFLHTKVIAQATARMQKLVMAEIGSSAEHLALVTRAELEAARDPAAREAIIAELDRARVEAKELSARSALWQQVLNDGVADLSADADHDLRMRTRTMLKKYEARIDSGDPAQMWDELGEELKNEIAESVGDNFIVTHERSFELARRVAESFSDAVDMELPERALGSVGGELGPVSDLVGLDLEPLGFGEKMLVGMRGSYGGIMMFAMLPAMLGLPIPVTFSLAAGMLLGRKSYTEDAENRLLRRRAEAKVAIRTFVDDVLFEVGRESRTRLREIQRVLRDHFRGIAEQTTRSLTESLKAIEAAAKSEVSQQEKRAKELESRLKFLTDVVSWASGGKAGGDKVSGDKARGAAHEHVA